MNVSVAALSAIYPVVICLGIMLLMRFTPIVHKLPEDGTRLLVIGILFVTFTIVVEQIFYGYARLRPESYNVITNWVPVVGAIKIGYVVGMLYKLVAFWKISPRVPNLWAPLALAISLWFVSFLMLLA